MLIRGDIQSCVRCGRDGELSVMKQWNGEIVCASCFRVWLLRRAGVNPWGLPCPYKRVERSR